MLFYGLIFLLARRIENRVLRLAIQTGSVRRGNPIVDPVTGQSLGYEMEWVASPLAVTTA